MKLARRPILLEQVERVVYERRRGKRGGVREEKASEERERERAGEIEKG